MASRILNFLSKCFHLFWFITSVALGVFFMDGSNWPGEPSLFLRLALTGFFFALFNGFGSAGAFLIRGLKSYEFLPITPKSALTFFGSVRVKSSTALRNILSNIGLYRDSQHSLNWPLFIIQIPIALYVVIMISVVIGKIRNELSIVDLSEPPYYIAGIIVSPIWILSLFFRNLEGWFALGVILANLFLWSAFIGLITAIAYVFTGVNITA